MRRHAAVWTLIGLSFVACISPDRRVRLPAEEARLETAALPGDLDVAIRVDVDWLTGELGAALVRRLLMDIVVGADDPRVIERLAQALSRSELLLLGFRSGDTIAAAEKVLVLRGHFAGLTPPNAGPGAVWTASDSQRGRPHFFRPASRPGALTRLYTRGDEALVWVSEAEAVSVERWLGGADDLRSLSPPDRGGLSVAARPEPLRARHFRQYPELRQHFAGARSVQAFVDPRSGALMAGLELGFETTEQARGAQQILDRLRLEIAAAPCVVGATARATQLSIFERSVRLLAELDPGQVQGLEACLLGGECCA
jgi:hypothetical protein